MFKILKKGFKDVVSKFSKKIDEEGKEEVVEQPVEKEVEKGKEGKETEEVKEEIKKEKESFIKKLKKKVTTKRINDNQFEDLFSELELILLQNNVALEVIDKIKEGLKMDLVDVPIDKKRIDKIIEDNLKNTLEELFDVENINLVNKIKDKKNEPYVIVFVGINGSGKTTSIAKIANFLNKNKLSVVLVAADTWRQAAIEQLEEHGKRLGLKVIKHSYGSDPAAVAFDGIKYAKSRSIDAVLIDTAGRQHSNVDLMNELSKIVRVAKPDLKLFVGESITGNDCILQAKQFNDTVGIDGIILSKADIDEKGGAAISVSFVTKKPILYLGTGQNYEDLQKFDEKKLIKNLGF